MYACHRNKEWVEFEQPCSVASHRSLDRSWRESTNEGAQNILAEE